MSIIQNICRPPGTLWALCILFGQYDNNRIAKSPCEMTGYVK